MDEHLVLCPRISQIGFTHDFARLDPEEFENIGIADGKPRFSRFCADADHFCQLRLVHGKAGALVVEASNLALELAHGPVAPDALDFIERALHLVVQIDDKFYMAVGKPMDQPLRRVLKSWGRCPHFPARPDSPGQQRSQLWGQRPHNPGVKSVKPKIAIELAPIAIADVQTGKPLCQLRE